MFGFSIGVQDEIEVPDGYEAVVLLENVPGVASVKLTPDGRLTVGLSQRVITVRTDGTDVQTIALGDFWAFDTSYGLDGKLFIADPIWRETNGARLWAVLPGTLQPVKWLWHFSYVMGVCTLPDGNLVVIDPGWIRNSDGMIKLAPPDVQGLMREDLEDFVKTSTINPVKPRVGPDGLVYFLDRGFLYNPPSIAFTPLNVGTLYKVLPGTREALPVISGLNDPIDFAFYPDGDVLILDDDITNPRRMAIYKCDLKTGVKTVWARNFGYSHGIESDKSGNVYIADSEANRVYKIKRKYCIFDASSMFGIEKLQISGSSQVESDRLVGSNSYVELGGSADVKGNIYSGGQIVFTGNGAKLTGSANQYSPVLEFPDLNGLITGVGQGNDNYRIGLTSQGTNPLNGSAFELRNSEQITLTAGNYFFSSLKMSGISRLYASGDVRIFITGLLSVEDSALLNFSNDPCNVIIVSNGNVTLGGNAAIAALIYARNGEALVSGNSSLKGGLIAQKVLLSGRSSVLTHTCAKSICF